MRTWGTVEPSIIVPLKMRKGTRRRFCSHHACTVCPLFRHFTIRSFHSERRAMCLTTRTPSISTPPCWMRLWAVSTSLVDSLGISENLVDSQFPPRSYHLISLGLVSSMLLFDGLRKMPARIISALRTHNGNNPSSHNFVTGCGTLRGRQKRSLRNHVFPHSSRREAAVSGFSDCTGGP